MRTVAVAVGNSATSQFSAVAVDWNTMTCGLMDNARIADRIYLYANVSNAMAGTQSASAAARAVP